MYEMLTLITTNFTKALFLQRSLKSRSKSTFEPQQDDYDGYQNRQGDLGVRIEQNQVKQPLPPAIAR